MKWDVYERVCDISYAIDHYQQTLDILEDQKYSLKVVYKGQHNDMQGHITEITKVIEDERTDFIRDLLEEHQEILIKEVKARIEKLEKEIEEL